MKRIAVFLMTNEVAGREDVCQRTIEAFHRYIDVRQPLQDVFRWFVSAHGSEEYIKNIYSQIEVLGYEDTVIVSGDEAPGKRWNRTLEAIWGAGHDIYFRLENDFELKADLDITEYIEVLNDNPSVGMVRLGLMPINLDLHSVAYNGAIYFECRKSTPYSYSGNPGLIHRRLHEAVGGFSDTMNPGQIEVDFDHRYRACHHDIKILWPLVHGALGTYGPFSHIGEVQSYG